MAEHSGRPLPQGTDQTLLPDPLPQVNYLMLLYPPANCVGGPVYCFDIGFFCLISLSVHTGVVSQTQVVQNNASLMKSLVSN